MIPIHFIWMCGDTDTIVIEPFVYFLPRFLQNPETLGQKTESEGASKVKDQQTGRKLQHLNWYLVPIDFIKKYCLRCRRACISCWRR